MSANKILVLDNGELIAKGTYEQHQANNIDMFNYLDRENNLNKLSKSDYFLSENNINEVTIRNKPNNPVLDTLSINSSNTELSKTIFSVNNIIIYYKHLLFYYENCLF